MNKQINGNFPLQHLKFGVENEFHLNADKDQWLQDLLQELTDGREPAELKAHLTLKRERSQQEGELITLEAKVSGQYSTLCVKSGEPMMVEINFPLKAIFLNQNNKEDQLFAEQTEYYYNGHIFELYQLENKQVPLQHVIREHIQLNIPFLPSKDLD